MTDIPQEQPREEKRREPAVPESPRARARRLIERTTTDADRIAGLLPTDADSSDRKELAYLRRELKFASDLVAERLGLFPRRHAEYTDRSQQRVVDFAARHHFPIDDYTVRDRKLRIIDSLPDGERIPQDRVEAYLREQEIVTRNGVVNNCITVAGESVRKGIASGRAYSPEGCQDLVGWSNHAVNYDILPDGSVVAIDFTAASNIDWNKGNFDTMGVRARNQEELFALLGELYGGQWEDSPLGKFDR